MKNKITVGLGFGALRVRESKKGFVGFGTTRDTSLLGFVQEALKCCGDCGGTKNGIFQCLVIKRESPTMALTNPRGVNHQ